MAESYEVVERFSHPHDDHASVRSANGDDKAGSSTPATPRSSSRAREQTASPAPSQRQRKTSNAITSPSIAQLPSSSPAMSKQSSNASSAQRIANLIQRQYIYFTTLLQEPEPKWKPVTDSRGVTVSQLDSIDRNLVVYRAEATFVGVAVWDLFAAISTPGVRKAWEPSADDDRLIDEIRLPESEGGNDGHGIARQSGASGPQVGNNSTSGLSKRTTNGPPSQLWHFKQRAAWPVSARDSVLLSTVYRSPDCSSVHHFSFSTSDSKLFPSLPKPTQGVIRSQVDLRGWSIEALNPTTAHVTLIEQSDPKGWTTKSSSIPAAMVNAVAGVGAWAIKNGGPPIVTHLSLGAKQIVSKYEADKGRYRLEYELDRPSSQQSSSESADPAAPIPPVIECELRCDLDLWSSNLDLIIDPPPIHVSVLRRPKLSRNGAGGGLWLTVEHASASLGALNTGDDEEDSLSDDVARITVRKGDGITSENGVVLINGARMTVEHEEPDEQAKAGMSRAQRTKPKRIALDKARASAGPPSAAAAAAAEEANNKENTKVVVASPSSVPGLSAPIVIEGSADGSARTRNLDDDISQALAEHVSGGVVAAEPSSISSKDGSSIVLGGTSPTSPSLTTGPVPPSVSMNLSRSSSPSARQLRSTSMKETSSNNSGESRVTAITSPRLGDRSQHGTLRERDRNRDKDGGDVHNSLPAATTSALSSSFSASSPMMNVLSRLNAVPTATSSISNTQASGQLRIASGVEPPSRSSTTDVAISRTGSATGADGSRNGQDAGLGEKNKGSGAASSSTNSNDAHSTSAASGTAATSKSSQGGSWTWLTTKPAWLPSFGAPPAPRNSSSAAAAVLAEDEKRKQEREKAAARAAAKAAAKAKKGNKGTTGADSETASSAPGANAGAVKEDGVVASGVEGVANAAQSTADAAIAAATTAAANAQSGVLHLRQKMSSVQFSLPTLVLTAVIAFLFGSLVRALLSPADFVLLPQNPYEHFEQQQQQQQR
ncbi:hypothetical protein OC846_006353, partial [Tilletia horrida]